MKPLIMAIVQSLVDRPEEVQIKEVVGEHVHVLELRVAKEDLGKVIGKNGAHATAIRTILAAASGKVKKQTRALRCQNHRLGCALLVVFSCLRYGGATMPESSDENSWPARGRLDSYALEQRDIQ